MDKNGLKYGLMNVTTVVLDEADKLLSPGFDKETTAVINRLTNKAQMLAFSATFPFAIRPVVHSLMGEDEYVRIGEGETLPTNVEKAQLLPTFCAPVF